MKRTKIEIGYNDDNGIYKIEKLERIEDIPKNIITLTVNNKDLETFDCRLYSNLEDLDLSYNKLNNIILSDKLIYLKLSYNYLKFLDLTEAKNLKILNISYNLLTNIILNDSLEELTIDNIDPENFYTDEYFNSEHYNSIERLICNQNLKILTISFMSCNFDNIIFNNKLEEINLFSMDITKKLPDTIKTAYIYQCYITYDYNNTLPDELDILYTDDYIDTRVISRRRIYLIKEINSSKKCILCNKNINKNMKLNYRFERTNQGNIIYISCC